MTDAAVEPSARTEAPRVALAVLDRIRLVVLVWYLTWVPFMVLERRGAATVTLLALATYACCCGLVLIDLGRWRRLGQPAGDAAEVARRAAWAALATSAAAFLGAPVLLGLDPGSRAVAALGAFLDVCLIASRVATVACGWAFLMSVGRRAVELGQPGVAFRARMAVVFGLTATILYVVAVVGAASPDVVVYVFLLATLGVIFFFLATARLQVALRQGGASDGG
ncbi:MAG: hypothetical protein U1F43_37945 [Myxococcota bacterium]